MTLHDALPFIAVTLVIALMALFIAWRFAPDALPLWLRTSFAAIFFALMIYLAASHYLLPRKIVAGAVLSSHISRGTLEIKLQSTSGSYSTISVENDFDQLARSIPYGTLIKATVDPNDTATEIELQSRTGDVQHWRESQVKSALLYGFLILLSGAILKFEMKPRDAIEP